MADFSALNRRLTIATACVEVMSTGLNRFSQPVTGSPLRFLWRDKVFSKGPVRAGRTRVWT